MRIGLGDVASAATALTVDDVTLAVVSNTRSNARGYDVRLDLHGLRVAAGLPLRSVEPGTAFPAGVPQTFFMDRSAEAAATSLREPSPVRVAEVHR